MTSRHWLARILAAPAARPVLALALVSVLVAGTSGCTKHDSLVLLDLRGSGPLVGPVVRFRLSAAGWPTRNVSGSIGPEGFRVGYYGPADGGAVSVSAEALDVASCVLGIGSATVPALASGATSDPTTLFIRPVAGNDCMVVGGNDGGGDDGGGDDGGGNDGGGDDGGGNDGGGDDGGADAAEDAQGDAGVDAATDATDDTTPDASTD